MEDYLGLAINPLKCLRTIFAYLKYGVIKDDCFKEITQFCFNPPVKQIGFRDNLADEVLYLIGVITLKICQNPKKTIRFIQVLDKHYRNITDISNGYNFLFKVIMLNEYLCIGKKEEAVKIYYSLQNCFDGDKNQVTPFMETLFNTARIMISNYCEQYPYMATDARVIDLIVDKMDANLFKVYVQALLLKDSERKVDSPVYKQMLYDYKKTIRQNQLYPQLFLENELFFESQF
ncbi:hypothetical protein [Mucilaginibacter sp. SP1R1]|uniref:hypothetical protein n=1 Tax=Mucilaginibacter sp. SP1R1 TaxID=2723091 RepID=UPI00160B2FA9|nr:hypothetical protein [Mucilaginibacter sp. SP1R1]MBB6150161.1 hypothetical protein [Mucilaginibacter sp. SP1R1]